MPTNLKRWSLVDGAVTTSAVINERMFHSEEDAMDEPRTIVNGHTLNTKKKGVQDGVG